MNKLYKGISKKEAFEAEFVVSNDFFANLLSFYNCLKIGDRELAMYNIAEMKKHMEQGFVPDIFRLAYINIVNCFSLYLDDELVLPCLVFNPKTVDEGFDKINELLNAWFEKVCASVGTSNFLKYEVLRIVESEFSNPLLSVTMLADKLGISTSYLSRYFKDKAGVTLFSYIDEIRISKAKQLLAETSLPVKAVVKSVGYNDINNFNRKFKSKTGKTPSDFRKKHNFY